MDNLIYLIFISIFVPLFLMCLLVEKKSRLPIVFVLLGTYVSLLSSEINGLFKIAFDMSTMDLTVLVAPITEEILKAVPILFLAIVISDKKELLFTASMASGIGFAILENAYHLIQLGPSINVMDAIVRAFGTGLMHGMCTLLVGVGISFVKKKRKIFLTGSFALLSTAIMYHSVFNMLIQSQYKTVGLLLPIVTYIPFFVWRVISKRKINNCGREK